MKTTSVALLSVLAVAACSSQTAQSPAPTASKQGVHWSYSGEDGPEFWGDLSPAFAECSIGDAQSPIEIADPVEVQRPVPVIDYQEQPAQVLNNGHSIEATAGPGGTLTVDGVDYALVRMHFHTPAENVIDGLTYPAELHFVHESESGEVAVLGVMLEEGADNPGMQPYVDSLDLPEGAQDIVTLSWDEMVPDDTRTVRFTGSLTTPDCTGGLNWLVATTPVEVGAAQLQTFRDSYEGNARPVQPLNDREVTIDAAG